MLLLCKAALRRICSTTSRQLTTPYVPVKPCRNTDEARALLNRFLANGMITQQALTTELARAGGTWNGRQLVEAAAQAIAAGSITLASQLSAKVTLFFDDRQPSGNHDLAVRFPNQVVAEAFVVSLADKNAAFSALQRALAHPRRQYWLPDTGQAPVSTQQTAFLLLTGRLRMVPVANSEHLFQLLWQHRWQGRTVDDGASSGSDRPPVIRRGPLPADEYHWVEIELLDSRDKPVPGEPYIVTLPTGKVVRGLLDADGWARIDYPGSAGACTISFPNFDKAEWQQHQTSPLPSRHFA